MTKLFFVRHGKTEWNLERRYQGARGDSPLLDQSYQEIKELSQYLQQFEFAKVYASPIKRARITAQEILKYLNNPPRLQLDDAFKEFNLGKMEGMKFSDVKREFPHEYQAFRHDPSKYRAEVVGGESFQDVFNRMTPKIQEICRRYPEANILIVSHGAALGAEIRHLLGYSLEHLRDKGGLSNTSTTILESYDGQSFTCLAWDKVDYLSRQLGKDDKV